MIAEIVTRRDRLLWSVVVTAIIGIIAHTPPPTYEPPASDRVPAYQRQVGHCHDRAATVSTVHP
jgi:hypothetical protein